MATPPTPSSRLSRRSFLLNSGRLAAAAALAGPLLPISGASPVLAAEEPAPPPPQPVPGKERLLMKTAAPLHLELPADQLTSWITPNELHFVRNHFEVPQIDPSTWTLLVDGEVDHPLTLTLDDLRTFESVNAVRTLECAGNGRGLFTPKASGTQWGMGAVGTARYVGLRLGEVLRRAGLRASGKHVMFNGADAPALPSAPDFIRSIPIGKALDSDTLLVHTMNGEPLPLLHGAPLRVVPAGWIGSACVKWLIHIRVLQQPHDGQFMAKSYRFPKFPVAPGTQVDPKDTETVTRLDVKTWITSPANDTTVPVGRIVIRGAAWAGEADIAKVEVSTDSGRTWQPAQLGEDHARYAWRLWDYYLQVKDPGSSYLIMARATDSTGRTQPVEAVWNPSGYFYNPIPRVRVNVVGT